MKNKLFSYIFLSLFSSSGLQATVYAVGTLTKGDKKVYFFSGIIDRHAVEKAQAQLIHNQANALQAHIVYGNSIDIKYSDTYEQLKQIALREAQNINATVLGKGTYNGKKQAFEELDVNDDTLFGSFPLDEKKKVREFFDVITRNRMIDAIEKLSNQHIFVYTEPIHGAVVWGRLISEGWSVQGDNSIETFAKSFAGNYQPARPVEQTIVACGVQPVDIDRWFATLQPTNETTAQPVVQCPQSQESVVPTESFFTARNMFACAVGVTAVAALVCVAVKNNVVGWLKKKIAPTLIVWGTRRKNPNATLKGFEYFGLIS